jgi:hypothetical protein
MEFLEKRQLPRKSLAGSCRFMRERAGNVQVELTQEWHTQFAGCSNRSLFVVRQMPAVAKTARVGPKS